MTHGSVRLQASLRTAVARSGRYSGKVTSAGDALPIDVRLIPSPVRTLANEGASSWARSCCGGEAAKVRHSGWIRKAGTALSCGVQVVQTRSRSARQPEGWRKRTPVLPLTSPSKPFILKTACYPRSTSVPCSLSVPHGFRLAPCGTALHPAGAAPDTWIGYAFHGPCR